MILKNFFTKKTAKANERRIYELIVAQARQPWFYAELDVPDTVEGRYDMIMLHSFLVINRLTDDEAVTGGFVQGLFDELFKDMDRSLREMGVGDLAVPKKIRKMAEAFNGRAAAYKQALGEVENDDTAALKAVLARNIYASGDAGPSVDVLARYVVDAAAALSAQSMQSITAGSLQFPVPGHP